MILSCQFDGSFGVLKKNRLNKDLLNGRKMGSEMDEIDEKLPT